MDVSTDATGIRLAVIVKRTVEVSTGLGLAVEMLVSVFVVVSAVVTSTVEGGE